MSSVIAEPIQWLWPARIPLKKLSTIAGDPGLGKSLTTLDIASRVSTGRPFTDGSMPPKGDTLIMTTEDDPADTIRPRLDACFADTDRIHFMEYGTDDSGKKKLPDLRDLLSLRDALEQIRERGGDPKMIVVDPIEAYLAGADAHTNAEVREVLSPLAVFARKEGVAIITVQHLNKGQGPAAYRVGGSIAFTAQSRAVWIVTRDQEDENLRLFLPLKMNIAKDTGGLSFHVSEDSQQIPFVKWEGPVDSSAREALEQQRQDRPAPLQDQIVEYLGKSSPAKTGAIAEALRKGENSISRALGKLESKGRVESTGVFGEWQLSRPAFTRGRGGESSEVRESGESYPEDEPELSPDSPPSPLSPGVPGVKVGAGAVSEDSQADLIQDADYTIQGEEGDPEYPLF